MECGREPCKRSCWFRQGAQQAPNEFDCQHEPALIEQIGWTILRAVTMGIVLAVALNWLIGYVATLTE